MLELVGSDVPLVTLALFFIDPVVVGITTMVTVALEPLVKLPRLQDTVLVPEQLPRLEVADTKVVLPGIVSVTVTFDAVLGPLFVTVML